MVSKENKLLELFFNSSQHWHFEELKKTANIGRPQLARWLKLFEKQGIIKRVKPKGKMPYYVQNTSNPAYQNKKRLYAWEKMLNSGLFNHLASLPKVKAVVLFGSFARADWHQESDIDLFIFGDDHNFEQGKYELKMKRDIQIHTAKNSSQLKKIDKLLPYILSGTFIKGSVQDLGVKINAQI